MVLKYRASMTNRIPGVVDKMGKARTENLLDAIIIWHDGIVNGQLTGGRSGRRYTIPGTKRKYTASAPGEAPASRTGNLRTGYRFQIRMFRGAEAAEVGSPEEYAVMLEKGTKKMAPRPHVEPAYQAKEADIKQAMMKRWDR